MGACGARFRQRRLAGANADLITATVDIFNDNWIRIWRRQRDDLMAQLRHTFEAELTTGDIARLGGEVVITHGSPLTL